MKRKCLNCNVILSSRFKIKFCSNKCQTELKHKNFIDRWKKGIVDGSMGIRAKGVSRYVRRYLVAKYGEKCSLCGWNKIHKITNRVPLEIDHIDGDAENNKESNLRLLCPNCHSLTSCFRNLNKGNGRKWRKDRYLKFGKI